MSVNSRLMEERKMLAIVPGVSNRTKSNQNSIELSRTPIVRLGSVIEQNRTSILL